MIHLVDQLKEELKTKNKELLDQDEKFENLVNENNNTKSAKHRVEK